jgi:hypothetical protein
MYPAQSVNGDGCWGYAALGGIAGSCNLAGGSANDGREIRVKTNAPTTRFQHNISKPRFRGQPLDGNRAILQVLKIKRCAEGHRQGGLSLRKSSQMHIRSRTDEAQFPNIIK